MPEVLRPWAGEMPPSEMGWPASRPSGVAPSTMPSPTLAVTAAAATVEWASWKPGMAATTSLT